MIDTVTQLFSHRLKNLHTIGKRHEKTSRTGYHESIPQRNSPFNYAISYWLKHAMNVPHGRTRTFLSESLWEVVQDFFWYADGAAFAEWLRVFCPDSEDWHEVPYGNSMVSFRCLHNLGTKSLVNSGLHVASSYGLVDILDWAHDDQADFDIKNGVGMTPLMYAAYVGDEAVAKTILSKKGICINRTRCDGLGEECRGHCGTSGKTALMDAADCHRLEVMRLLLKQPDIEVDLTSHGNTALGIAISGGFSMGAELLSGAGAKLAKVKGKVLEISY
jgi:hypothetical protein